MRLKEQFSIRNIGGEYMMVSQSGSGLDYTRVVTLNHTAAFLVESVIEKDFTEEDLIDLLVEKYDVARDVAAKDVQALVGTLLKEGLVEKQE
ncbi:MAG: PqqD family protein [Bacteroidales bacterium]|jgi:hypothetical protein